MSTKVIGDILVVEVQSGGTGGFVDVSGASRTFEYEDAGTEIDTTTRDSTAKEYETSFPEISAKFSGLTLKTDPTPAIDELPRGSTGDIKWYPEGKVAGRPMYTSTYTVIKVGQQYPYDGAVSWNIDLRLTSAIDIDVAP